MLKDRSLDLILLDWGLPRQDGLSLLKGYRLSGGDAPVIFLTARDEVHDRVEGLDGGEDDYLCKPFAFAELLARVRALACRRERPSNMIVRHGDVSVDLVSQKGQRAGQDLDLTAKELALLCFFLRHPARFSAAIASMRGSGMRISTRRPTPSRSTSRNSDASSRLSGLASSTIGRRGLFPRQITVPRRLLSHAGWVKTLAFRRRL